MLSSRCPPCWDSRGFVVRSASLDNHVVTGDVFDLDPNGILMSHHGQGATQTFSYLDPFGACYKPHRRRGCGTELTDGAGCPAATNTLSWFDIFHNYASSFAGDTVQLLPYAPLTPLSPRRYGADAALSVRRRA